MIKATLFCEEHQHEHIIDLGHDRYARECDKCSTGYFLSELEREKIFTCLDFAEDVAQYEDWGLTETTIGHPQFKEALAIVTTEEDK